MTGAGHPTLTTSTKVETLGTFVTLMEIESVFRLPTLRNLNNIYMFLEIMT